MIRRAAGRRPKIADADQDSRAAILASARSVFARRGFEGASTREVAQAAGVNNAMIYYHFKDKDELYRAVLVDSFSAFERIWDDPVFSSAASARVKIRKFIEEFIRFQHANEDLRKIMSMEFAVCSQNYQWLAENHFVRSNSRLVSLLKEGMRNGELKKCDPSWVIPSLVGMIIHSFNVRTISEHITGKKTDLSAGRFGRFVMDLFFDGLRPVAGRDGS